jgi:hypothetical protein
MFDPTKIQQCMVSLLGWRNDANTDVPQITDPSLLQSDSGLIYNDFHSLLTIENITNSIPEDKTIDDYLNEKVASGINKALTKVVIEKKLNGSTKTLLNSSKLFDGIGRFQDTIISTGSFVGVELEIYPSYGAKVIIDKIGLQFTQTQTNLAIYIFHTSQIDPIKTVTASTVKSNSLEWLTLSETIDLSYLSNEYDSGGLFYIGYFQDDINGQAIKKDFNYLKGPCNTCRGGANAMKIWNERLNFVRIVPVEVVSGNLNGTQMFDYTKRGYVPTNNFGLNFGVTVQCDISDYLCEQKFVLSDLIGKQIAVDILNDMKHSTRLNRIANVSMNMIIRDLEGDNETQEPGLAKRLSNAVKAVDFDFSKIDSPCLPCNKKWGIRKGSI